MSPVARSTYRGPSGPSFWEAMGGCRGCLAWLVVTPFAILFVSSLYTSSTQSPTPSRRGAATQAQGNTASSAVEQASDEPAESESTSADEVSGVVAGSYTPGWMINYASMKSKSGAMKLMRRLEARGERSCVLDTDYFQDEKGKALPSGFYAVTYGSYSSRASAAAALRRPGHTGFPRYAVPNDE